MIFFVTVSCHLSLTLSSFSWQPNLHLNEKTGRVGCTDVVMADGKSLIRANDFCFICNRNDGLKLRCDHPDCIKLSKSTQPEFYHATCARQAGLEVGSRVVRKLYVPYVRCYRHGSNAHNIRARLEDFLEIEHLRSGFNKDELSKPMTLKHPHLLIHSAMEVLRILGWAWRWSEWWVEFNSSWEPLLAEGQKEEDFTKKELKIVESSRESRCADARRCRLAAFGAALQNRCYDKPDGEFDNQSLGKALRAILETKSLVGPLTDAEKNFIVDWFARAYRSKHRLLGYGEHRILPNTQGHCIHRVDGTPKFMLNDRPVPGTQELEKGQVYEMGIEEPDDFLLPDMDKGRPNNKVKRSPSKPPPIKQQSPVVSKKSPIKASPVIPGKRRCRSLKLKPTPSLATTPQKDEEEDLYHDDEDDDDKVQGTARPERSSSRRVARARVESLQVRVPVSESDQVEDIEGEEIVPVKPVLQRNLRVMKEHSQSPRRQQLPNAGCCFESHFNAPEPLLARSSHRRNKSIFPKATGSSQPHRTPSKDVGKIAPDQEMTIADLLLQHRPETRAVSNRLLQLATEDRVLTNETAVTPVEQARLAGKKRAIEVRKRLKTYRQYES